MPLPLRQFDCLYHVGHLQSPPRSPRSSLEGHGLSVSLVPEVWRRIARLGDSPCYRLERAAGAFLDAWAVREDSTLRTTIETWACQEGFLVRAPVYTVEWFDDEWDQTFEISVLDPREAREEAEDRGGDVREIDGWLPTVALCEATLYPKQEPAMALDLAMLLYADRETDLDGVYWADDLVPDALSAPRGCIFPSRLGRWSITLEATPCPQPSRLRP